MAQLVELPLCSEAFGSVPGHVILKSLRMVLAVLYLVLELGERNWSARSWYNVTVWNIISSVLGMIFQLGSTLKEH